MHRFESSLGRIFFFIDCMNSNNNNHDASSNQFVWNEANALWYAEEYGDHISNDLTIKNIELNPNDIILDIGCGTGTAAAIASKICHKGKIYGIDPIETMINIALKNIDKALNVEFILGSAERIPLNNKSVDKVIAINSIHHWKDYKKGLLEVNRVLKSDGLFFISNDIVNNEDCGHGTGPLKTNKNIMDKLTNAGFTGIRLQDYILESDGIHIIQSRKV